MTLEASRISEIGPFLYGLLLACDSAGSAFLDSEVRAAPSVVQIEEGQRGKGILNLRKFNEALLLSIASEVSLSLVYYGVLNWNAEVLALQRSCVLRSICNLSQSLRFSVSISNVNISFCT